MVAGRTLTWPILVGTLLATWIGSGSIFGGGTLGYQQGFAALWQPAGAWLGIVIIYFVAGGGTPLSPILCAHITERRAVPVSTRAVSAAPLPFARTIAIFPF